MAKVLVIEDTDSVRKVACRILRNVGHEIFEASDGIEGVEVARRERPDVVVTDLLMPNQEGAETIRQIREIDASIPIIAISGLAMGDEHLLQNARDVGADMALEKPFAIQALIDAVDLMLKKRQA